MINTQKALLDRMVSAVEAVRRRLERATELLGDAGIPYAVVGGNAVGAWVARVDQAAVRNTQDVDILIRRSDLPAAITAMESGGFVHRHAAGIEMFLDGEGAKARDSVHIVFAGEKVREEYVTVAPDADNVEVIESFRVLELESLVRMKLTSFRLKDRVHVLDMIDVGLIDETWPARFQPELAARLQELLDNPEG
ncbi:MAG: hypothetical protein AB7U20_03090 [Planctomycetaceae bacterium]